MKRVFVIISLAGLMSVPIIGQTREDLLRKLTELSAEMQGQASTWTRAAVETRVTRGKPYSGEAVTEFVQVLGDGNRIMRKSSARLSRDNEGRTRREELNENGVALDRNSVVITDPVAGVSLILDASTRTARKTPAMFAKVQNGRATVITSNPEVRQRVEALPPKVEMITVPSEEVKSKIEAAAQIAAAGRGGQTATFTVGDGQVMVGRGNVMTAVANTMGETTKEDLGQQSIEGVTANGTRTTTVIPTGAVGNEQPITIVSEQWFSPDLEMLVLTRHSDPRVGETTYRLTNITRNEPDRSLFQAPPDYTVVDRQLLRRQQ